MIASTEERSTVQRVARYEGLGHADKLGELVHGIAALRRTSSLDVEHLLCLAEIGRGQDEGSCHMGISLAVALWLPEQTISRYISFLRRSGYLEDVRKGRRRLGLALTQQGREAVEEAGHVLKSKPNQLNCAKGC